ncbi:MAG: acyl-ACP--UDP-N-acetylglucosamine O-acyltransferase [Chlamydiota bacterium]
MANIHPTAIVEVGAKIGKNVEIEPYAIIKGAVTLGDDVVIKSHAYIDGHTTIGDRTTIWPGASIGTKTQDLKFQGEKTFVKIGKDCEIREFVTVNASCGEGSTVSIGDNCLLMAYCHVAHNCIIGNHVIMSNGAMLAGHVTLEDFVIIGGMTPIHQFSRIGRYAMVGGLSRVTSDIPPYTLGAGVPYRIGGLNLIGLKRHRFCYSLRKDLTKAFKLTYRSGYNLDEALERIEKEVDSSPEVEHWLAFCRSSKRGLIGLQKDKTFSDQEICDSKNLLEE